MSKWLNELTLFITTNMIRKCFKMNRLTLLKTSGGNLEEKQILHCRSLKNIAFKFWIVRKRMRKMNEWNPCYGSRIGSHIYWNILQSTKGGVQTLFMFPALRNLFNSSNYSTALPTKYSLIQYLCNYPCIKGFALYFSNSKDYNGTRDSMERNDSARRKYKLESHEAVTVDTWGHNQPFPPPPYCTNYSSTLMFLRSNLL